MQRSDFIKTDIMFNRLFNKEYIAVVCCFEDRSTGTRFIVANAHMFWNADFCDVKLVQVGMLMDELEKIAHAFARYPPPLKTESGQPPPSYSDGTKIPTIVCGDYNSVPRSVHLPLPATITRCDYVDAEEDAARQFQSNELCVQSSSTGKSFPLCSSPPTSAFYSGILCIHLIGNKSIFIKSHVLILQNPTNPTHFAKPVSQPGFAKPTFEPQTHPICKINTKS